MTVATKAGTLVSALALLGPVAAASLRAAEPAAVDPEVQVLADLRKNTEGPAPPDAVYLALFRFARTSDPSDLGLAEWLARRVTGGGPGFASPGVLFAVASAGGNTGGEAESNLEGARQLLTESVRRATTDSFARLVLDFYDRAAYLGTEDAYLDALGGVGSLFTSRVAQSNNIADVHPGGGGAPRAGLADRLEVLNVAVVNAGATGSQESMDLARNLGYALIRAHWDEDTSRLRLEMWETTGLPAATTETLLNARAALALWRAGCLTGEALFMGRAERILSSIRKAGLADPVSAPAVALLAAVVREGPLVVAVVGDPATTEMIRLRRDALSVFYPGKVVLPLDPARDEQRIHDLGCPGNADRAAFVIRNGDCGTAILSGVNLANVLGSPPGSVRPRTHGPR